MSIVSIKKLIILGSLLVSNVVFAINAGGDVTRKSSEREAVKACLPSKEATLIPQMRQRIAGLLGWHRDLSIARCQGYYLEPRMSLAVKPRKEVTQISADSVSFYNQGRSELKGKVKVEQSFRQVTAETAYVYRDAGRQITKIELMDRVYLREQGRLILAKKAVIYPHDKSGQMYDVIYRIARGDTPIIVAEKERLTGLNAWGSARKIERFANGDSQLDQATYTTCPPLKNQWRIQADRINLDKARGEGIARNATLRIKDWPVFYTPYLKFPTDKRRKSGFLMPLVGYSNQNGFNLATPYYWNMAPNHDMVITPHLYSRRGLMLGSDFRYLTEHSSGELGGNFLPDDRVFGQFLRDNQQQFPELGHSNNRWGVRWNNFTRFNENFDFNADVQQVSDDYYLQDFTTNLAWTTENQLARKAYLNVHNAYWLVRGGVLSYQTLHPVNQSVTADVYQRLPQVIVSGAYDQLPLNLMFALNGEYDYFAWSNNQTLVPQGSRYHINPIIAANWANAWGYIKPTLQLQQTNYQLSQYTQTQAAMSFDRSIPQVSVDSGLFFDRDFTLMGGHYTQTLEPRIFYLYVPYVEQFQIPTFDSAYYTFNYDQLTRFNRFSGIDRVADANQISYAVATRLLDERGFERASFSIGQTRYFKDRKVQLCFNPNEPCLDNPNAQIGYSSPTSNYSPVAAKLTYSLWAPWSATVNWAWDPDAKRTTTGNFSVGYLAPGNRVFRLGYTYMVNGDNTVVADRLKQDNALNQLRVSYAWPLTYRWSTLGAYGYNISKGYDMTYLLGVQYEDCCWAARLLGGKVYRSINNYLQPEYTSNVYFQILFKGLATVSSSDPSQVVHTYIPGYNDPFNKAQL